MFPMIVNKLIFGTILFTITFKFRENLTKKSLNIKRKNDLYLILNHY